jgi:3',5'-nucleoside bisphosphate phosphatase
MKSLHSRFSCILFLFASCLFIQLSAQESATNQKVTLHFPDIPGYKTLICDFHQHTVFSDGSVWPDVRVGEALIDGLDAMAITDHLEYMPHKDDIPNADHNRPYQLAFKTAQNRDLLVINGAEITRSMPPGHANALFLKDANKLLGLDDLEVFREARKQDAFVIWNHPHWYPQNLQGTAVLTEMHKNLIKEGLIQGIEIVNEFSYSDEAFQIALDNNLTIMSGSDIHGLISTYDTPEGGRRPVTLVFAAGKTEDALKEALFQGRTVVSCGNQLFGKTEFLVPLIQQSFETKGAKMLYSYNGDKSTIAEVTIQNNTGVDYILENQKDYLFYNYADIVTLKSHSSLVLQVKLLKETETFKLRFRVLNAYTAPSLHPLITMDVRVVN